MILPNQMIAQIITQTMKTDSNDLLLSVSFNDGPESSTVA